MWCRDSCIEEGVESEEDTQNLASLASFCENPSFACWFALLKVVGKIVRIKVFRNPLYHSILMSNLIILISSC